MFVGYTTSKETVQVSRDSNLTGFYNGLLSFRSNLTLTEFFFTTSLSLRTSVKLDTKQKMVKIAAHSLCY